jgi:2-polyprenyl-3-methyl-5-hydroxy-6-metoxy-1,4-benzoquinol methylase
MQNQLISTKKRSIESYKGMTIHAAPKLHEEVIQLFHTHLPRKGTVIDIGAGAGAFSQRLHDNGFKVTAVDVDPDKWLSEDVNLTLLDINIGVKKSLKTSELFDSACCLEVIEHVENPWNLLREAYDLVKPGGKLILSTPNITSFLSRILFLLYGNFPGFGEASLSYGHINPLTEFEILNIAKETGWEVVSVNSSGYLPILDFSSLKPRRFALNILSVVGYLMSLKGRKKGHCLVFVLKK